MVAILSLTAFSIESNATTWKVANQVTVAWDAVTTLTDGTPIPAGSTISIRFISAPILQGIRWLPGTR